MRFFPTAATLLSVAGLASALLRGGETDNERRALQATQTQTGPGKQTWTLPGGVTVGWGPNGVTVNPVRLWKGGKKRRGHS